MRSLPLIFLALTLSLGCDEVITIDNTVPKVELHGFCQEGDRWYLMTDLIDHERLDLDLRLIGPDGTLAPGPTGDGLMGLTTAQGPTPVLHAIEWGAGVEDLGDDGSYDPCAALAAMDLPGPTDDRCATRNGAPVEVTLSVWAFDEAPHELGPQTVGPLDADTCTALAAE
jgi:hypothetical protein